MRSLGIPALSLIALTACGFTPVSGSYTMGTLTLAEDTCGLFEGEFDGEDAADEPMQITVAEDGSLTVQISEGEGAEMTTWDCELDGKTLACTPNTQTGEEGSATLTQTFTLDGTFAEENVLDFEVGIAFDCEGDDCAEVGVTFPCQAALTGTATGPA